MMITEIVYNKKELENLHNKPLLDSYGSVIKVGEKVVHVKGERLSKGIVTNIKLGRLFLRKNYSSGGYRVYERDCVISIQNNGFTSKVLNTNKLIVI